MTKEKDISIIIPVYNVEPYLLDCLESVKDAIKDMNVEVLLIDDGSTDQSGVMAEKYAENDPCFFYYHKQNGGLGSARNYGVSKATGRYLMFLDSDDLVAEDMYRNMLALAERTGSELTICNVSRFTSKHFYPSSLHKMLYSRLQDTETTHITKESGLFYDTIACNKLILRSFFVEHAFAFPENHTLFEDIPVTLPMHYLANKVAVLHKTEYFWREREGNNKSITQSNTNLKNITDRLNGLETVFAFYQKIGNRQLLEALQLKVLVIDLHIYLNMIDRLPRQTAEEYVRLLNDFIDRYIDKKLIDRIDITRRQKYRYLFRNDIDGITKTNLYTRKKHSTTKVVRKEDGYHYKVPGQLFDVSDDAYYDYQGVEPNIGIDEIRYEDRKLLMTLHIFNPKIETFVQEDLDIEVYLSGDTGKQRFPLTAIRGNDNYVGLHYGGVYDRTNGNLDHYTYDHASFQLTVDLSQLDAEDMQEDLYYLGCRYRTAVNEGICLLRSSTSRIREKYDGQAFSMDRHVFTIAHDSISQFYLKTEKLNEKIEASVTDITDREQLIRRNARQSFALSRQIVALADGYLYLCRDQQENLLVRKRSELAVWKIKETKDNRISYHLDLFRLSGKIEDAAIYLAEKTSGKEILLSECVIRNRQDHYEVEGDLDLSILKGLPMGDHPLYVRCDDADVELYAYERYDYLYKEDDIDIDMLTKNGNQAMVNVFIDWKDGEKSPGEREYIREVAYREYRKEPLSDKLVIFESIWGTRYSNSPRSLYEYIDANHPDYTCVWSFSDPHFPINGRGIRVRKGSAEYFHYLATARYLVNDVNFEAAYRKREGQIEIQTMHGTPYKSLGLDSKKDFLTKNSVWTYVRRTMSWDYLISQGRFMDRNAYRIFRYYKTILKTGYPRTDALMKKDDEKIRTLKEHLKLPLDKKIILYAPTWRERGRFDLQLDLPKLMKQLGDEYVFAVRVHYLSLPDFVCPADNRTIFDLTSYYNIEDLYQIADILITDYSSVMFDFALMDKPMLFYVYDLEEYENELRGAYFDLRKEAPGPMVYTQDELAEAICDIDRTMRDHAGRIDAFKQKFLTYENDHSCEKVFDAVFVRKERSLRSRILDGLERWIAHHLPPRMVDTLEKIKIHLLSYSETKEK